MVKYLPELILISFLFSSCKKETEKFVSTEVTDYYPLEIGKYITYDLDSTVYYINFGQQANVINYQVQDRVDAHISDNQGRPAYRILRFIRKDASQQWVPNNTFMVVPTANSIEFIENNLRYLKLEQPVKQDFSWKGNSFIDTYSNYTDVKYLEDWDYIYDSINVPLIINSLAIDSTIKVFERDEFLGQDPSIPGTQYAEKNYAVEKYGKGIGLIYREFLHWEYQGTQPGRPAYYVGYGVKLSIIDHN
ncbi:MAG TPA: hypothetical protein VGP55_04865 [Chitinophagaceae bacterium]|nr:hypothetical protein [Chitinophagaceae bacterium]